MTNQDNSVLILEDEEDLNDAYTAILKKEGFKVESAKNGEEGLEKLESFKPDLVLLDLRMPKMNGIEFLKESEFSQNYPNSKIIVFTNFDVNDEIKTSFELGAHRYVLKASLTPKELIKLVTDELAN